MSLKFFVYFGTTLFLIALDSGRRLKIRLSVVLAWMWKGGRCAQFSLHTVALGKGDVVFDEAPISPDPK